MSVGAQDIFGGDAGAQPASPGSYGEAPEGHRLPEATRLGRVVLQVADLTRSMRFYEHVLGFRVLSQAEGTAKLAAHASDRVLIELRERKGAKSLGGRGRLGLFHFAILLPDRPSLARFVRHLSEIGARAGAGDHLVSEAFYLNDPDGLGIEVYADRPRDTWQRVGRELMMATDPVDIAGLVAVAGPLQWVGMPNGTTMGHVHLHVGDIARASAFYSDAVGFDRIVWSYPGALFLAAGGYHHHLGTNVWAGADAPSAAEDDARLVEWTIELPTLADVDSAAVNIARGGFALMRDEDDAVARDPWGTQVRLHALGA
ncbi:MAG: VOC family protein [Gemmatimonadaceae bacterium]|jgi:catechol 2,3-dioxygenase|nr:VOC family protein [Gemmatimonadaceae bacterium]